MRPFYYEITIDGNPILVPDADISVEFSDLDDNDSGRDEMGFMHRVVLRHDVKKFPLSYAFLTMEEYRYMESLFRGKSEFLVKCRNIDGQPMEFLAYRSNYKITFHNARSGMCKNYGFNIVES